MMKELKYHLKYRLMQGYYLKRLKDCQIDDFDKLFDIANLDIIRIEQKKSEILPLLKMVKEIKPKRILEIGSRRGGSLFLFSKVAPQAHIFSINDGFMPDWRKRLFNSFTDGQMIPINKDSHNPWALETIKDLAGYLDFLFIDGDHSYEGVKKDWEMYSPLVRKGGLIAFHDIAPNYDSGSRKFYNEIKDGFEHVEFVEDAEQDIMGIGVLRK